MAATELKHLRTLIAVADSGSMTAAATRLSMDTSAVSRIVQDVEVGLGVPLFERHARGVRLTTAGRDYVDKSREVIALLSKAEQDARLAAIGVTGRLSIGFVWSFAGGPAVSLLRAYSSAYPEVAVSLAEDGNDELIQRVLEGDLDAALIAALPSLAQIRDGVNSFVSLPLWLEPLLAALPDGLEKDVLSWADLATEQLICRPHDDRRGFSRHVELHGGPVLRFVEHDIALSSLLGLVAAGVGWAIIPTSAACFDTPGVRLAEIKSAGASLQVEAIWRPSADNPALMRFVALLRQTYGPSHAPASSDAPSRTLDPSP